MGCRNATRSNEQQQFTFTTTQVDFCAVREERPAKIAQLYCESLFFSHKVRFTILWNPLRFCNPAIETIYSYYTSLKVCITKTSVYSFYPYSSLGFNNTAKHTQTVPCSIDRVSYAIPHRHPQTRSWLHHWAIHAQSFLGNNRENHRRSIPALGHLV